MCYGIRLANGDVHLITERIALTNAVADDLLGARAEVVWVDPTGTVTAIDVLDRELLAFDVLDLELPEFDVFETEGTS